MTDIVKKIAMTYDSMEELFNREHIMLQTLDNYLKRDKRYEFLNSYITQGETSCKLVLEIKLKDEYNS